MNCQRVEKALPELLDGGGSETLRAAVAEHLAGCPACRCEREALIRSWELIDAVRVPPASQGFTAAVMARVRAAHVPGAATDPMAEASPARPWWPASAAVIGLVTLLAVSALLTRPPQTPMPELGLPTVAPPAQVRTLTDDEIIRDLDVYEHIDLLDNLALLADLDVLEDSDVEL